MGPFRYIVAVLALSGCLLPGGLSAQTAEPVVHAVIFYSPTCPHCHEVITEHLIPLQNQYGNRLVILGMDTSQPWANNLYWEAIRVFEVPQSEWAVPFLVVGDKVLVGGLEIPSRLPSIIEEGLASGGIDLPDYPAMVTFLEEQNVLDPRYPDRLIAKQTRAEAPTEGEGSAETSPTSPARDSAISEEPPEVEDSAAAAREVAADTVTEGERERVESPDPVVSGDSLGAVSVDSAAGRGEPRVPPVDSAPAARRAEEARDSVATPQPGGEPEAEPSAFEPDSAVASVPPSPAPGSSSPGGESPGSFGLEDAARDLETMTMWDRFNVDPTGNSLSVLVLLGMIVSLILRGYPPKVQGRDWPIWVIPALVFVGAAVASYLSFVEVARVEAVCGPVGDCNTVNQSEYAYLFGVLPVGVLGLVGYAVILAFWALRHFGSGEIPGLASLGLWGAALFGTVFSVYLTFLEPFVIGATCAWCLTSAVIMTLLLWVASPMAARAWPRRTAAFGGD